MNRRNFIGALPGLAAAAQTPDSATTLFDGKTLAGWHIEQGPETAFHVLDNSIAVHESAGHPAWLRSSNEYENFDLRGEFFIKGWMDSGIYLHAPLYGRPTWEGIQIKIFHQSEDKPETNSMGSLFPLLAPLKVNVGNQAEWNTFRVHMDWPRLRVWTNGELIQDVDLDANSLFRYRLRRGYIGFASLSYPIRFRNLSIRELQSKEAWQPLYSTPADFERWFVTDGKPRFEPIGNVLRADGTGHFATREKFKDFELRMYIRAMREHNSGILFRSIGQGNKGQHYEIQLHDVEDAHYPTGSLYHFKRASYPRIQPEQWFPFQLIANGASCLVRINGDTVLEYDRLDYLDEGHVELQAHREGYWTEFKQIRIKRL